MSEVFFSCKRMTGIEPASKAWEALILPMNYIRICYIFAKQTTERPQVLRLLRIKYFFILTYSAFL